MLRSVDLQQIFSQTSSLEKIQNIKQQHPDVEHKHFVQQLKEEDERNRKEVKESQETRETEIRDEEKGKKGNRERKRGKAIVDNSPETRLRPPEISQGKIVDVII